MKVPSPLLALCAMVISFTLQVAAQVVLPNNATVSSLNGFPDEQKHFRIDVPAGVGYLIVQTFGGQGDVDLYVRKNAVPNQNTYDYASNGSSNNEVVEITRPGTGAWHIILHGASSYTGVTLQAFYGGVDETVLEPGAKIFEFPVDGWADSGAAVGRDGTIYLGANNDTRSGFLYAISDKGFLRWREPLNGWIMNSAPVIGSDERLFVNLTEGLNGSFGNLVCFLPNGEHQWTLQNTSPVHPPTLGYGNTVYIPSRYNSLFAVTSTKASKWEFFAAAGLVASTPAIVGKDGVVYIGFHHPQTKVGMLYAINPNGSKKWELPLPGKMSPPTIDAQGRILFGIVHPVNKLWAVTSAGQKAWEFQAPGGLVFPEVHAYSPPVVALDGTIYISCDRRLYAVDSTGKKKWDHETGNSLASVPFYNGPAVDGFGNIYYGSFGNIGSGKIYSLNSGGGLNWEVNLAGQILGYSILTANNRLVVTTRENKKVYVFRSAAPPMGSSWPLARVTPQNIGSIELEPGPTVTINQALGQPDPTTSATINFTVIFNKPVTGFANSDVVFGGTAMPTSAVVSGSGASYNVAISGMSRAGTVTASIPAGVVVDVFGTGNFASTSTDNVVNYQLPDTTRPTVVINQALNQADPTASSPILFTVIFSEPVTGFTTGDVFVSGTAGANTATVMGAGAAYQVTVFGMVQSGTVTVVVPQGVAQDAAGNLNVASTSNDNVVSYQPVVKHNISVTAFPTGGGFVTGGGQVQAGTTHKVSAFSAAAYSFEHWTENGTVVSLNPEYTFNVTGPRSLTAIFEKCNALLTRPAVDAEVTFPLNLQWTMLGGCESKIYFATNNNPLFSTAVTNIFGEGTHNFTLPMDQWKKVVQTLGTSPTYYWTIGSVDPAQRLTFAAWQRFRAPAPDSIAPTVSITSHVPNQIVTTNKVTIRGTATDGARGESGIKYVKVNGVEAVGGAVSAGNIAQWTITQSLVLGSNEITVVAADGQDNQTGMQMHLVYHPPAPRFVSLTILRAHFQATLSVQPGITYVIEASEDLKTWAPYFTGTATSNSMTVSSGLSSATFKYFRARAVVP